MNQILWNNQLIRVDKLSVFSLVGKKSAWRVFRAFSTTKVTPCWRLNLTTFMQKYNVKGNFIQYYNSFLSAIPLEWKPKSTVSWIHPACNRIGRKAQNKTIAIFYSIISTSLIQLQSKDSLNTALSFKKDKNASQFLFVVQWSKAYSRTLSRLKEARKGFLLLQCLWNDGRLQRRIFKDVRAKIFQH